MRKVGNYQLLRTGSTVAILDRNGAPVTRTPHTWESAQDWARLLTRDDARRMRLENAARARELAVNAAY